MNKLSLRPEVRAGLLLLAISTLSFQFACFRFARNQDPILSGSKNDVLATRPDLKNERHKVETEINQLLLEKKFDAIESKAVTAREKKQRLAGGYWKIDAIYEGLISFLAEYSGQRVTDELWKNRIELLKVWTKEHPESVTARIALARGYIEYGWFARGNGTINTVAEADYRLFHERLGEAESILVELGDKGLECPRWYREVLFLGMINGWPEDEMDRLYESAIRSEPNYLQYYLTRSEYLTPKWHGKPGDWQDFVDALPGRIALLEKGEADIIYFVVVANKVNDHSLSINWTMISKERVRKGFQDLEKKYGPDNTRLNHYAFVASLSMDLPSAGAALKRIGDDRDSEVWDEVTFTSMKSLAKNGIPGLSIQPALP